VGIDWSGVYAAHADQVYRIAWLVLRDEQDSADVLQSTFERAYRARAGLDGQRPVEPWLLRIAANEAISLARRRRIRRWVPLLDREPAPGLSPHESVEARAVWAVVDNLSPAHRAVVGLHYVFGYSIEEVADLLRVPKGTVASRLHYARSRLRSALADQEGAGR
jgi:RNA polymerase sigma-70 factor (ECF subfamily)